MERSRLDIFQSIGGEHSDHLFEIVNMMEEQNFINSASYDAIIDYYIEGDNLDMGLHKLAEMNDRGMNPNLPTAQRVILKAAEQGYPRLAMDLATAYENSSLRRIDSETWVNLLAACADNYYVSVSFTIGGFGTELLIGRRCSSLLDKADHGPESHDT